MHPLDWVQSELEADAELKSMLSVYQGYPAITQEVVPDGMQMPYLILRSEADVPSNNPLINEILVSIDVYAEGDRVLVRSIGNRIEKLLDMTSPFPHCISCFRAGRYPIEQPDPSIKMENLKFKIRYPREDLID
ncbi:hypothetical protein GFC29_3879 (plasmid) [Anoxybacillus sp. B7M1]|uniref:tail completion protein gp17 n=1 Tax=Anoxybacillus sp. B7M1 TaxID=1490057 RepID=UPI0005CD55FB|nr:DUF3168 domain-containing protein [Anoxybacillus sp. B7M1]ANB66114.1 hypothetical protein GFC29_3879 [Anoxybacillus sp. B7M1]